MLKKLKEFKTLIGVIIFIFLAGVACAGWLKFPKRLERAEKKIEETEEKGEETKDNLKDLAHNLDKYIAVNEQWKTMQMKILEKDK